MNIKFFRDTAGKSRFESLGEMFLSEAMGVIFCFDITDKKSFTNLPHWMTKTCPHLHHAGRNPAINIDQGILGQSLHVAQQ